MDSIFPGYTPVPDTYVNRPSHYLCDDIYMAAWLVASGHEVVRSFLSSDLRHCTMVFKSSPELTQHVRAMRDGTAVGNISAYRQAHKTLYRMIGDRRRDAREKQAASEGEVA